MSHRYVCTCTAVRVICYNTYTLYRGTKDTRMNLGYDARLLVSDITIAWEASLYTCNAGLGTHLMCIAEAPAGRDSVRRDLQHDALSSI